VYSTVDPAFGTWIEVAPLHDSTRTRSRGRLCILATALNWVKSEHAGRHAVLSHQCGKSKQSLPFGLFGLSLQESSPFSALDRLMVSTIFGPRQRKQALLSEFEP